MPASLENTVCVLSLGLSETAASTLVDQIRDAPGSKGDGAKWRIMNRYYDADVAFRVWTDADAALAQLSGCPAVILLVDPSLALDVRYLEQLDSQDIDVALVVGMAPSQRPLADDARQRWDELCLEHGFEFVDLAEVASDDEDGSTGIARVREALQAHAWPSATPASRTRSAHPSVGFDDDFTSFISAPAGGADPASVHQMREYIFATPPPSATARSFFGPDDFDEADASAHFDLGSTIDRLRALRLKADAMDEPTRRAFAETVSIAFASHLEADV